jgi:hypothetical protein
VHDLPSCDALSRGSVPGLMLLSFVDRAAVQRHLTDQVVTGAEVHRLLRLRAIPDGTPMFLDEVSLRPVEPLSAWCRHLAYDGKAAKTMREYAYIVLRFCRFLASRGRDVLSAGESDLQAYRARRITVQETAAGLEPLAVFVGHGGQMLGPSSWYRIRCAAWERMRAHAGDASATLMPRRRWRWHDTRHTFALQLLSFLERQMDGEEPDAVIRRRRHMAYLGGHIRHNPLLIVSRRLGHASPATTYDYLQYSDDPMNAVEAAFREWTSQEDLAYVDIAAHMLAEGHHTEGEH